MANTIKKYLDTQALETLVDQIKAEDDKVLAAAKKYTDEAPYEAAGAAATAKSEAIADADAKFAVVNENVAKKADTTALEAETTARTEADTALQGAIDGVDAKVTTNTEAIAAINHAETGILKQAKDYTDTEVAKVQGAVDALGEKVGELPEGTTATTVIEYVNKKTEGIATDAALGELNSQVSGLQTAVQNIQKDYLVEADKTELQGAINDEASARETADNGLATRIKAVEDDYLKGADKEELQGNIDTLTGVVETLRDGVDAEKVDGVIDLITYVEEHGTEVTGMKEDIAENTSAISGVTGRVSTLEGQIATKAEAQALTDAVTALEGEDAELLGKIEALEAKFGEGDGSVEDMIADAKQEAIDAAKTDASNKDAVVLSEAQKYADAEDAKIESRVDALETASATHALASDLTALGNRVTAEEGKVSTLQTEMDAVEALAAANKAAHEANAGAIALKASQADLDAAVGRIATNEGAITTINETLADKAEADDLDAAVERIAANEAAIAANTSAIGKFQPITSAEVEALFA